MTVIDVHAHWMPASFAESVAAAAAGDASFARRFESLLGPLRDGLVDVRELVRGMDAAGVDLTLLSVPPPAAALPCGQPTRRVAAQLNEALMAAAGTHPDRLMAVLSLPLPDIDGACEELLRWVHHPRLAGVCVPVANGGPGIDAAALESLYQICAAHSLPVFLHPALDEPSDQFSQWNLHSAIGAPVASTVAAARLVLSGLLDRLPTLTVVVPHLGGALPFLFGRLVEQSTPSVAQWEFAYYLRKRLFYDTCAFHPPALRCAVTTLGIERLILGSDYPFRGPVSRAAADLADQLTGTAREAVLGGNAERLLAVRTAGS